MEKLDMDMSKYAMPIVFVKSNNINNNEQPKYSGIEYEFKTLDGVNRKIAKEVIFQSAVLKNIIEDYTSEINCLPIEIDNDVLTVIEQYGRDFYMYQPIQVEKESHEPIYDKKLIFQDWERKYMDWPIKFLCKVTKSAHYLDFNNIYKFCIRSIASHITGKNARQIREIFGIANNFTPEEEYANYKECEWAFS